MKRAGKNMTMALRMLYQIPLMHKGAVVGVAGNTLEHSEQLCALVRRLASERGVSIAHVTLKPLDTERLVEANKNRRGLQ